MGATREVAVSGAGGRLGRALVQALATRGYEVTEWSRPDYDLDEPSSARRLVDRDRPELVIHPAAWTDVDGCARQPELAMRRNAAAVRELAEACARASTRPSNRRPSSARAWSSPMPARTS